MRDHKVVCNNIVPFEDFFVLADGTNDFRIKFLESLSMHLDGQQFNKISESTPSLLFLQGVSY